MSPRLTFRERVLTLGAEANIIAISTEPARVSGAPLPTVIFLNAGVLHRVGPHRLHVSLARRLAELGFKSLRVDLSGIGDSRTLPDKQNFRESAVADTRSTMAHVSGDASARFVLFGLCSGADNALAAAAEDARVVGLILIDAPAYVTRRAKLRTLFGRGLGHACWAGPRLLVRAVRSSVKKLRTSTRATREIPQGRQLPPQREYGASLRCLVDRGVQILSIYSGALGERYNAREQLFEVYPALRGRVDVAFFPAANHVFTELAQRQALMSTVESWCRKWVD